MRYLVVLAFAALLIGKTAAITADDGCSCAKTKSNSTTYLGNASVALGCSFHVDDGFASKWCLADTVNGTCGTYTSGIGYISPCTQAGISNVDIGTAQHLEWDQGPRTFYMGQLMTVSWTATNINENVGIQFNNTGRSLRYLNGGSSITTPVYSGSGSVSVSLRISDSNNNFASNTPMAVFPLSQPSSFSALSTTTFSILASSLTGLELRDNNGTLSTAGGFSAMGGEALNVRWRGVGAGQLGTAGIVLKRSGGCGFGCPTYASIAIPAAGNVSYDLGLPMNVTSSSYSLTVTVTTPLGSTYTVATAGTFNLVAPPPSPTPTPSNSGTPSKTPSPSYSPSSTSSPTPTPTSTSSATPTPTTTSSATPTPTSTNSATPSTTPSHVPSEDVAALVRKAAEQNSAGTLGGIVGAVVGTVVVIAGGFVGYKLYQRRQMSQLRLKKLKASSRWNKPGQGNNIAPLPLGPSGIADRGGATAPVVMYQVNIQKAAPPPAPAHMAMAANTYGGRRPGAPLAGRR